MVTDAVGSAISGSCANTFKKFIFHNSDLFQEDRSLCVSEAATVCLSTLNLASCIGKLHIVFSLAAARSRTPSRFIAFFRFRPTKPLVTLVFEYGLNLFRDAVQLTEVSQSWVQTIPSRNEVFRRDVHLSRWLRICSRR